MPFFKSHPETAGPANVFTTYPEIYRLWSEMSQELMNGPSPLTSGEREMIASFVVGTAGCKFAYVAHSEAAYAHGVKEGLIEELLDDIDTAEVKSAMEQLQEAVYAVSSGLYEQQQAAGNPEGGEPAADDEPVEGEVVDAEYEVKE